MSDIDKKEYDANWFKQLASSNIDADNLHLTSGWTNFDKNNYEKFVKKQIDMVQIHPDDAILEIGCGVGAFLQILPHANITGIDVDDEIIQLARKYNPGVNILKCDATKLIFENNSFDVVFVPAVLGYIDVEYHDVVIDEIKRVLKPGGFCVIGLLVEDPKYLLTMKTCIPKSYWENEKNVKIEDFETWDLDKCDHIEGRYVVSFEI